MRGLGNSNFCIFLEAEVQQVNSEICFRRLKNIPSYVATFSGYETVILEIGDKALNKQTKKSSY